MRSSSKFQTREKAGNVRCFKSWARETWLGAVVEARENAKAPVRGRASFAKPEIYWETTQSHDKCASHIGGINFYGEMLN